MEQARKSVRIVGTVLVVYALLVATHEGEFWPFSIYPMFSQAGQPWTRAMVREVPPDLAGDLLWRSAGLDSLPGTAFAVARHGLFQNDLANYVSKTTRWDAQALAGLRAMFDAPDLRERTLLVMKVRGAPAAAGVDVRADPLLLLAPDTVRLHPRLQP